MKCPGKMSEIFFTDLQSAKQKKPKTEYIFYMRTGNHIFKHYMDKGSTRGQLRR